MTIRLRIVTHAVVSLVLTLSTGAAAHAQATPPLPATIPTEPTVTMHARGAFEVKLTPQAADDYADAAMLGRMTIDKEFHGDLEATSKGQMLTGLTSETGSAGYVAIERVTGTLGGRRGTFVLQHGGTMDRGAQRLTITVIPDSGTGELTGLTGTMTIEIADGRHSYAFAYTIAGAS